MNPDDFKNLNRPHKTAIERENERLLGVNDKPWPWYAFVISGVVIAGFAAFSYYDITAAENEGRDIWMPKFIGLFYDLLGKWGVVGLFATLSIGLIGFGFYCKLSPDEEAKQTQENVIR